MAREEERTRRTHGRPAQKEQTSANFFPSQSSVGCGNRVGQSALNRNEGKCDPQEYVAE